MKIWSRTLTHADLERAAEQVNVDFPGCSVYVAGDCDLFVGPRTRYIDHVSLASRVSTRYRNRNTREFESHPHTMAASWTEWGWWLARLFVMDPDMRANDYRGVADFNIATNGRFIDPRNKREIQVVRYLRTTDGGLARGA